MVKEGKKITGPEQLKDAAFGCARIRGDTLGIVGLGKPFLTYFFLQKVEMIGGLYIVCHRLLVLRIFWRKKKKLWANFVQDSDMKTFYEAINSFSFLLYQ